MEIKEFKKIFGELAKSCGFERAYEGWFKEFPEVIFVLDLQKSNFGNYYYLNIKLFIQGMFGKNYTKSKELVKKEVGNIFLRQPDLYLSTLDLDTFLEDYNRKENLKKMFDDFIVPFITKTNTKEKIKELYNKGDLFILPAVKEEIGIKA